MTDKQKEARDLGYHSTIGCIKALATVTGIVASIGLAISIVTGIINSIEAEKLAKEAEQARLERLEDERKSKRKTCVYDFCKSPTRKDSWVCSYHIGDRFMIPASARKIRWRERHTEETVQIPMLRHLVKKCSNGKGQYGILCPLHLGDCPKHKEKNRKRALSYKISQLYVNNSRAEAVRKHKALIECKQDSAFNRLWPNAGK